MNIKELSKPQKMIFGAIIIIVLLVFLIFTGIIPGLKNKNNGGSALSGEIKFWGVDSEDVFKESIDSFQALYPEVKIAYTRFDQNDYETELLDALASDRGPDLLMIGHNWVPKHFEKLTPIQPSWLSNKGFKELFVDVAADDLIYNQKIWGLPLFVDTLALYYNKDFFNNAGLPLPPENWDDFQKYSTRLTEKSSTGQINRAGASLGTASNIFESADVIAALMMQSGSQIVKSGNEVDFNNEAGRTALSFYTSFANPSMVSYSWNSSMPDSLEAFSRGQSAMMINYSSAREKIEKLNSYLNYGVASLPQLNKNSNKNVADYWAVAVSGASKSSGAAWQFAFHLVDAKQAESYSKNSGKSPARRDLISKLLDDESLGVFANQALSAKTWLNYNPSKTKIILKEMIEAVVKGRFNVSQAISQAANEIGSLGR